MRGVRAVVRVVAVVDSVVVVDSAAVVDSVDALRSKMIVTLNINNHQLDFVLF